MVVFGTRPEAIKMAPVVKELQRRSEQFKVVVCVTGQHREMLDQMLGVFDIHPDYDLDIMQPGQDLYDVSSRILLGMRDVLTQESPDLVLVHGDTSTSTFAALAAFYLQIPVGHVEAGLRTNNIYSPWPEEMNRQLNGRLCTWHFAPTETARQNLLNEHVDDAHIVVTGNTVIDALHWVVASGKAMAPQFGRDEHRRMVLITGHRRENFGDGMKHICQAINALAEQFKDVSRVCGHDAAEHLDTHRQRRHTGGGSRFRKAGAGDARHHRASRSHRGRYGQTCGHRQRHHHKCCSRSPH